VDSLKKLSNQWVTMAMFSKLSRGSLAKAVLFKDQPIYVQFYITARCNLTCKQCNIIYANSDVRECSLDEVKKIADNFAAMNVAMVLLTGGEPFMRKDLPEIVHAFESRGVHVRMQTNGHATEEQIHAVIEAGGRDISISLDSLWPSTQEDINGGVAKSWHDAIRAMSIFSRLLPSEGSFASLGCVLQRDNLPNIIDVIRFGSAISWFTSLVPIHITTYDKPMNFRTYDQSLILHPNEYPYVDALLNEVREARRAGYLIYDSDQYLDDISRFVKQEPTTWRSKNGGVCDSPNLYFAVLPNGHFAPCCDHRIKQSVPVFGDSFPTVYREHAFRQLVREVTEACSGCMYGSYPEMTISMRFLKATLERIKLFVTKPPKKNWPISYEEMLSIAERIRTEPRERIRIPDHIRPARSTGSSLLNVIP
jgi:MoaA/NifB/PqqE/SkfB family radical SAM enzyme